MKAICACAGSSAYMLWLFSLEFLLLFFLCVGGTLNSRCIAVCDSFSCSGDPFPTFGLPPPFLISLGGQVFSEGKWENK